MKKCTQCGQVLSDDTKFCFKCGSSNFEPAEESGSAPAQQSYYAQPAQQPAQQTTSQQSYYAQPSQQPSSYQQPSYQPPQPAYQRPLSSSETVSTGMNFLFLFLAGIPLVGLIFAIIVAASSGFKQSYRNLGKAWLILFAIQVVLLIIFSIVMHSFIQEIIDSVYGNIYFGY